jgi:hexosaminidase
MSALSEVLWSPKDIRNWQGFEKKLQSQFKRYQLWNASYSKAYYEVKVNLLPAPGNNGIKISAEPRDKTGRLEYQLSGQQVAKNYSGPVVINKNSDVGFNYYRNSQLINTVRLNINYNKATGKKVSITHAPNEKYPGQGGAFSLVNGVYSKKGLSYPDWLGFIGDDIEATIDLGKVTSFDSVRMHTINQNGSWIYLPQYVEVSTSVDGKKYVTAGRSSEFVSDTLTMGWMTVKTPGKKARFIKVFAKNYGLIPDGKPGAGNKAWVFADEIQVY